MKWIPGNLITSTDDVIVGGEAGNGVPFEVCRGNHKELTIPGKFYKPTRCCYVPYFGGEVCVKDYSLLVSI